MKFLADQDVYAKTVLYLRELGYDVVTAADLNLSLADDTHLLMVSKKEDRIFITRDRDFGGLVFVEGLGSGVIYLRVLPSTQDSVHEELKRIVTTYSEDELKKAFVVVEGGRHRFRKLPDSKK